MMNDSVVDELLAKIRPFLLGNHEDIDPLLPEYLSVLRKARAPECYHKHGTFFDHLVGVYRILNIWNASEAVARCGLFHSAYSNSYVNLAMFKPDVDRQMVRDLIGSEAEELVHMFCIVPRQKLIYEMVLLKFTDDELVSALNESEKTSYLDESKRDLSSGLPEWRKKIQEILPVGGLMVKHIRTGDDLRVPRRLIAIFLFLTMADFVDQLFGYQDKLFENVNGRMEYAGNTWKALWPGDGKPGLWMNFISRMGALLNLIAREEREFRKDIVMGMRAKANGGLHDEGKMGFDDIELVVPPVFDNCTVVLSPSDELEARDLYWEAICMKGNKTMEYAEPLLVKACNLNRFIGEPHLVLAQIYLSQEKYMEGEEEAKMGLKLLLEWGTNWDKRMTWEGWISWGRVMLDKARERSWPQSAWGIINLGLVS